MLLIGRPDRSPVRVAPTSGTARVASAVIWIGSVAVPIVVLQGGLGSWSEIARFFDFYGDGLAHTLALALVSGGLGVLVAVGLAAQWSDHRPAVRAAAHVQAVGWLVLALVPGTIVGVALEAAYNRPWIEAVYQSDAVLVLGHLARFGFIAALLGRWCAAREPTMMRDLRRLDGATTLGGYCRAAQPRLLAIGAASLAIVFVLAMSEVPVTARIHPPGSDPLAVSLLNAMHYQRPTTVIVAVGVLLFVALLAALVAASVLASMRRRTSRAVVLSPILIMILLIGGCGGDGEGGPLDPIETFGVNGLSLGQFSYPRCIDVDAEREFVYVIDKTARVQRFDFDGEPQLEWRMPKKEQGKPTGVSVAPDGRVFVADTHYFRVIVYDAEGSELMRFGSYGEGPGEFIYTTDIAFGPEGRLYVAEYGGNDRIQVFTPDGEYLFEFGTFGDVTAEPASPGPDELVLNRPQSIMFSEDRSELFIADAVNHRIVVTDPEGNLLRSIGRPGREQGDLHYPYGLAQLPDGSILVAEFGSNRIQRFSADGRSLGVYGVLGAGEGELRYPWGVACAGGRTFVLDSGNNRVQVIRSP
jgi:DNA-binding beta-propeller fold protein YncE/ABC-type spermidine/putrescine transport system permease subunit II